MAFLSRGLHRPKSGTALEQPVEHRCDHHRRRGSGVAHVLTNPREYHAIVLSKRGDIAAHVSLSVGDELHWRAFVFEAATNKECPANDDWARTPKHADIDEYRERVERTIDVNSIIDDFARVKARKHNM